MSQPQHEDGNQHAPSTREPAEPSVAGGVGTTISSAGRKIVGGAGKPEKTELASIGES